MIRHLQPDRPKDSWPLPKGFDRHQGTSVGAGSFFDLLDCTAIGSDPSDTGLRFMRKRRAERCWTCPLFRSGGVASIRRGIVRLRGLAHVDSYAAPACSSSHRRYRPCLPGAFQIISRPGRRALLHRLPLCRAECTAGQPCVSGGTVALEQPVPLADG